MRKTEDSGKTLCSVWLSSCADAKSWPKGFSMMTRAWLAQPVRPSAATTVGNMLGGMAR